MTLRGAQSESGSTPVGLLVIGGRALLETLGSAGHTVTPGRLAELGRLAGRQDVIILLEAGQGGQELAALARARAAGVRTPVIAVIDGEVEARVRALEAGADDCLSWPIVTDELEARIRAVQRRAAPAVHRPPSARVAPPAKAASPARALR